MTHLSTARKVTEEWYVDNFRQDAWLQDFLSAVVLAPTHAILLNVQLLPMQQCVVLVIAHNKIHEGCGFLHICRPRCACLTPVCAPFPSLLGVQDSTAVVAVLK